MAGGLQGATTLLLGPGGSAANALQSGVGKARTALADGTQSAYDFLSGVGDTYAPLVQGGSNVWNALLDATGANGAEGNTRATAAFQSGPGYEFTRDQGLDAITRTANARGMLAGGNTSADLLKYATGLADNTFGSYISRLSGLMPYYQQGLQGTAGALTAKANAAEDYGRGAAGLESGYGSGLSNIYSTLAGYNNTNGLASAGMYNDTAKGIADLGLKGAQAQGQASANSLKLFTDLALGGAKLGMGLS